MPTSTAAVKATTLRPPGGAVPFLVNASTIVAGQRGRTRCQARRIRSTTRVRAPRSRPWGRPAAAAGPPARRPEPREPAARGVGTGYPPVVRRGLAPPPPGCDDAPVD